MFNAPGYLINDGIVEVLLPDNQIMIGKGKADFTYKTGTVSLGFTRAEV
jgi:hypothetical protein